MFSVLFLAVCISPTMQEMSQELGDNITDQREHANDMLRIDFSHTGHPLAIVCSIMLIGFLKPVFERVHAIPHSVMLLIFGIVVGWLLSLIFKDEEIYLRPDWFFVYLLPPIVLEAGYFLKNKDFFHNVGTICVYAVIGTLLNTAALSVLLYSLRGWFVVADLSFLHCVIFSTLICAVDPVAVLCVFEAIHVNELLYICVFGESLLNDAVTIVLYHTVTDMLIAGPEQMQPAQYSLAMGKFFWVAFGGIIFGIVGGFGTSGCMRLLANHQVVQPILMLLMPFIVYLCTDTFHLSGILAIVTCGILIKNYMQGNVCDQMHFAIEYIYKMASSYAESLIFVFLGVSVVSSNHVFDPWFIVFTLLGCLLFRFIGVYFLTFFINLCRRKEDQILVEDQFIMAYGGLRGAVCYGLVMSIDENLIPAKRMFVTTTLAVIMFTTVVQGTTIKFLVDKLKVKRSKMFGKSEKSKRVMEKIVLESAKHVKDYLEYIVGEHGENAFFRKWQALDEKFLKPVFTAYSKPRVAVFVHQELDNIVSEFAMSVKKGGTSFAGLPTDTSITNLHLPASKSELFTSGFDEFQLMPPCKPNVSIAQPTLPPVSPIPRNVSVSGLVTQAFENTADQRATRNNKRRSLYSRHLLTNVPATPVSGDMDRSFMENSFEEDKNYLFTFPCSKAQNQQVASSIRKFSNSLKDPNNVRLSAVPPARAKSTKESTSGRTSESVAKQTQRPPVFSLVDEEKAAGPVSRAGRGRAERTVNSGHKTFTVGEDMIQLLPIKEEDKEDSSNRLSFR